MNELLIPFRQGADAVLIAAFDEPSDTALETMIGVASSAVLVFDGLFLHRPEFAHLWDVSVFLDADERRDAEWLQFLLDDLPVAPPSGPPNSIDGSTWLGGHDTDRVGPHTFARSRQLAGRRWSLTTTTWPGPRLLDT